MSVDRCVCCGAIIPEGRQVCPTCERNNGPLKKPAATRAAATSTTINKGDIRRKSRTLTKKEMSRYLQDRYGVPGDKVDAVLRECLPSESAYQTIIMEWIRNTYPRSFVWKAAAGPYSRGGIPDICAIINGRFYGFEVKRPYLGKLSRLQEETIKAIKAAGGKAAVVSFPEQVAEVIGGG